MPHTRNLTITLRYALIGLAVIAVLFPLYWVIASSFKPAADVFATPPVWLFRPSLSNYSFIFGATHSSEGGTDFLRYLVNSAIISVGTAIPSLILGSMAAYGITRCRIRWGERYLTGILIGRILPPICLLVPLFTIWSTLRLVDTQVAVVITYLATGLPFVVWMMSGFFRALPRELDEAAQLDGCSRLGALWRVVLPCSVAGLLVTGLFAVLGAWNEFLVVVVLTANRAEPISVAIQGYVSGFSTEWGPLFAASTIAFVPVLVMGIVAQRYLVRGFSVGVVTG
jgi:multiple sugar transport system permease protein